MGWFVKIFFGLLAVAVIGGFVINRMPEWKQRVVEVINPAVKEGRLLGELSLNLEELESSLNNLETNQANKNARTRIENSKNLIGKSKELLGSIRDLNQKNSGIIKQQVGKVVDALLDRTPYPADHLQVSPSTASSPLVCPPTKN